MSTRIPVSGSEFARLHAALDPRTCYTTWRTVCEERFGCAPLAAYISVRDGGFTLDPQFSVAKDMPHRWSANGAPANVRMLEFQYRDRTLGGFAWAFDPDLDFQEIEEITTEHFAPAFFRASYLAQALAENSRSRDQLHYLSEMGNLLGVLDVATLLVNILELTSGILDADLGSIVLLDAANEPVTELEWGLPHEALVSARLADGVKVLDCAFESREPLSLRNEDVITDGHFVFDGLLVLPLVGPNGVLGSMNFVGTEFGPDRLEVVRPGVSLAAIAVENAMLVKIKLEREREQEQLALGKSIQQGLLPKSPPEVEGVELAGHSESATMIGGDYFDYFKLADDGLGLLVADVAGKGVAAGLIMTAARAMFRAACIDLEDPRAILEQVNNLMCAEEFGGRFVTAVFVNVDPKTRVARIASAGHEPTRIFRASDATIEEILQPALPLGLRDAVEYDQRVVHLQPGDAMVLHTDGVNEAMDLQRVQFGDQLDAAILAGKNDTAEELMQRILSCVDEHIGDAARHDDTTLITARMR